MKVKFFADNFNARFTWSWVDGEYVTEDSSEIEHLKGLGLRYEEQEEKKKPAPRKRGPRKKAD